ncbi:MAG: sulfatase-like hydrolase/transferase [Candidatus Eisenbacteria bacterium]
MTDREREIMTALYDGEIRSVDRWLGRLFDGMKDLGIYDEAIILFLADHGEEFGDHGGWFHGRTLYQEMIGMPLVLRLPGGERGGTRSRLSVDMVDLYPTLCGLSGIDGPEAAQGTDFAVAIRGGESALSPSESLIEEPPHLYGIRRGKWKLVRRVRPAGDTVRLFDLAADPGERIDFAGAEGETAAVLGRVLDEGIAASRALAGGVPGRAGGGVDPETRRQLKALGYVE